MRRKLVALLVVLGALLVMAAQCPFDPDIPDPSPDPTPDPDPNPGQVLFFDDFEDGMDPVWQTTAGWQIEGGVLIHDSGDAYGYLDVGTDWSDYVVEVELEPRGEYAALLFRCQEDLRSYVMFYGDTGALRFKTYVDADNTADTGWRSPGFLEGPQLVRVVVSGDTYTVYINGLQRLTFTDSTFDSGMPGLHSWGWGNGEDRARYDNFRVTAGD